MSDKHGQVYIFDFGDKIKVGFSTNVEKRLRTIECSSGVKAKQIYAVYTTQTTELIAHSWLENRLEGEFFAFPFEQAKQIVDDIISGKITQARLKAREHNKNSGYIQYKIDIMTALKSRGYSSYVLMSKDKMGDNYIGQRQIQQIREGEIVSIACLEKLCRLLDCQPGDILEYVED